MRKLVLLAALALAVVPAAFADDSPTPDSASALCKQQRTAMGLTPFKLLYGGGSNAYGRCVSKLASTVSSDHTNAAKQCAVERADADFPKTHDGRTFEQVYGSGPHGRNAFGKCVSSKAQALEQAQEENTISAAKTCRAERTAMGADAFRAKYGGRANAFGKCVSRAAKANP